MNYAKFLKQNFQQERAGVIKNRAAELIAQKQCLTLPAAYVRAEKEIKCGECGEAARITNRALEILRDNPRETTLTAYQKALREAGQKQQ